MRVMTRFQSIMMCVSGFMGGCGVMLLAAGAHADASGRLTTAGQFLLFHAATNLALSLNVWGGRKMVRAAALLLSIGPVLFAVDLSLRVVNGAAILPIMAPVGGSVTILGWIVLALAGAVMIFRSTAER